MDNDSKGGERLACPMLSILQEEQLLGKSDETMTW